MYSQSNGEVVAVIFVCLDLKCVATFDLHLSIQEGLSLGVQRTYVYSALTFKRAKQILTIDEG